MEFPIHRLDVILAVSFIHCGTIQKVVTKTMFRHIFKVGVPFILAFGERVHSELFTFLIVNVIFKRLYVVGAAVV